MTTKTLKVGTVAQILVKRKTSGHVSTNPQTVPRSVGTAIGSVLSPVMTETNSLRTDVLQYVRSNMVGNV